MDEQNGQEQKENPVVEEAKIIAAGEVKQEERETEKEQAEDTNLEELISLLRNGTGYLAAITILSGEKLSHHLLTKNFPEIDCLKSINAVKKMIVERLESL